MSKISVGPIMVSFDSTNSAFGHALANSLRRRLDSSVAMSSANQERNSIAIEKCDFFVPLVTGSYANEQNAKAELQLATLYKKQLFPVNFLGDDYPPSQLAIQLSAIQFISKFENSEHWPQDQVDQVSDQIINEIEFLASVQSKPRPIKKYMISYRSIDAAMHALALKRSLISLGLSEEFIFLDVDNIRGGQNWQDALNTAVSECAYFICIVSSGYGFSAWTKLELELAVFLEKNIIPINFLKDWPPKEFRIHFANNEREPHLPISWPSHELPDVSVDSVAAKVLERTRVFPR